MPEGHTIHRYARLHRTSLSGGPVAASSPQGRFVEGAARIDGTKLVDLRAVGKHLFYEWSNGEVLHVHLGLFGRFRTFRSDPPAPTEGTRLALAAPEATIYLAGATIVELIDGEEEAAIRDRLGPDPLDPAADPARFADALSRRTVPVGAALLDQKAIAGIGNVYRSELLYLVGVHPLRRARDVTGGDRLEIWESAVEELTRGERSGRIVTVHPEELGANRRSDLRRSERLYVYKRDGEPCRRCGTEIGRIEDVGGRDMWHCPQCQQRRSSRRRRKS